MQLKTYNIFINWLCKKGWFIYVKIVW
ncbi:hypothetical protein CAB17_20510 [Legionella sainthelensi]|nr:hypothetical protein CAB17_20510 [Legionella sainthelensi]